MNKNPTLVKIGLTSLVFMFLLMVFSPAVVGVKSEETALTVDIWTDRGGQGGDLPGGTYQVGEETIFYLYVSTTCQVRWTIKGPSGKEDVREKMLEAGTHQYPDVAEEQHVGSWDTIFEAWAEEQYASDTTSFTIVEAGSALSEPLSTDLYSRIVGEWTWFNGGVVTISSDGTMRHDLSGDSGTWHRTDAIQGTFTLTWTKGGWVDTLTLSSDGQSLEGTNNVGMSVSGRKLTPEAKEEVSVSVGTDKATEPERAFVVLLEDNFDLENEKRGKLSYSGFANWDVTEGTVDLIGHGFFDFFPDYGLYLDLDGSTNNAGRLESKTTFRLEPGEYRLEFDLAGSPLSGPNTVTVNLDKVYSKDYTLDKSEPFRTVKSTISVPTSTSAKLVFEHAGADNQGLLLDNVKLIKLVSQEQIDRWATEEVSPPTPTPTLYKDAFQLSTGELIVGELLSFSGNTFRIRTETGVIEKKKDEIRVILLGPTP